MTDDRLRTPPAQRFAGEIHEFSLAEAMYGQANRADAIFQANRATLRNANATLAPGQTLKIPPV